MLSMFPSIAATILAMSGSGVPFVEGYAWPPSVAQGDTVNVCVSTDAASYDVEVLRLGLVETPMLSMSALPGFVQAVPGSAWAGCDWDVSFTVPVGADWPSGVYAARLTAPLSLGHAIFIVREDDPGSTARILFQCSINTWQAYDAWGGKSLYDLISNGARAHVVSFRRPYGGYTGLGQFPIWEQVLVRWMEREGYAVEYCTDLDTHADPTLQSHYGLFLVAGHDEYWSYEMRDNIEGRIEAGGNVAILGGNTCWWQIRYSDDLQQVICYKDAALDPLTGVVDSLVTVHWYDAPVYRPANTFIGASLLHGGFPPGSGYADYVVERSGHFVFDGTGLIDGAQFGGGLVVGEEVDGAQFVRQNGLPVPTGTDGTPPGFEILATSPASSGSATMGLLQSDSASVFNGASLTWLTGLAADPVTERITENVLGALTDGNPFWGDPEDVVLDGMGWGSSGGTVQLSLTFRNADASFPSRGVHGAVEGLPLGSLASAGAMVASFDLPSIPAGESVLLTLPIPKASLPASAMRLTPGGGVPVPGCPVDTSWAGGLVARWRVTGVPDSTAARWDAASLQVCPGSGFHHVQVAWDCEDSAGVAWSVAPGATGWSADLLTDASGVPGATASDPVPSGTFTGWIAVSADSTVAAGSPDTTALVLACGGDSVTVRVTATACACLDPTGGPAATLAPTTMSVGPDGANPSTRGAGIRLDLPRPGSARLTVHDIRGRLVWARDLGRLPAGSHRTVWNGRDRHGTPVAAGVYFLRLESGGRTATGKLVLLD